MDKKDISRFPDDLTEGLKSHVERAFGNSIRTPKEFESLRESIMRHTGVLLSATTLKRLWGYLDEPVAPRESTLNILASYAGWPSWKEFASGVVPEIESGTVAKLRINVRKDLAKGDIIRLLWHPERICDVEYLGDMEFKVISAQNTRLRPGDLFSCSLIISGEPLYMDNVRRDGAEMGVYVCGRRSGIGFIRSYPEII